MNQPLVSIIISTYNSSQTLEDCLASIYSQNYRASLLETIVVDNNSTDDTKFVALRYTPKVYNKGPERSAQRNYGVEKSTGQYVLIIDSDMKLSPDVVIACVTHMMVEPVEGIIIPEESFGEGFWAQCKRLERSFYVGVDWIEAARFFNKEAYLKVGGYDESMVSGEDWDLSRRIGKKARIDEYIYHNEGRLRLRTLLKKKMYYAAQARNFLAKNPSSAKLTAQEGPLARYRLFFSQPVKLFRNPVLGLGMLFMKTCEFAAGAYGYISSGYAEEK